MKKFLFILYPLSFITSCTFYVNPSPVVNQSNNEINLGHNTKNSIPVNLNIIDKGFNTKAITNNQLGALSAINHFKIALSKTVSSPPSAVFSAGDAMVFNLSVNITSPRPITISNLKAGTNYYLAARAYSSTDDSVNIVSNDGTPNGSGGGTSGTIDVGIGSEYIQVSPTGMVSIQRDGTQVIGGINATSNSNIDIEMQLMKSIGGQVNNNSVTSLPGLGTISAFSLIPTVNNKLIDFSVNTDTLNTKSLADISGCNGTGTNSGNYVIVWVSNNQDTSGKGIYGQLFGKDNLKIGSEFLISENVTNDQTNPKVAMADNGSFVIVWESNHTGNNNIYARRYQSNGSPLIGSEGNEFIVNNTITGEQVKPVIATATNGDFVIAWQGRQTGDNNIYIKKYTNAGTAVIASDTLVNSASTAEQTLPDIAIKKDTGESLVVWQHDRGDGNDIFARRFDSSLIPLSGNAGLQFRVNSFPSVNHTLPSAMYNNSTGTNPNTFLISWNKNQPELRTQYFDSTTGKKNSEELVLTQTSSPTSIDSAIDQNNNLLLSWINDPTPNRDIKILQYDKDKKANLLTSNTLLSQLISDIDNQAKITYAKDKYVITWIYKNQVKAKVLQNL